MTSPDPLSEHDPMALLASPARPLTLTDDQVKTVMVGLLVNVKRQDAVEAMVDALTTPAPAPAVDPVLQRFRTVLAQVLGAEHGASDDHLIDALVTMIGSRHRLRDQLSALLGLDPWTSDEHITETAAALAAQRARLGLQGPVLPARDPDGNTTREQVTEAFAASVQDCTAPDCARMASPLGTAGAGTRQGDYCCTPCAERAEGLIGEGDAHEAACDARQREHGRDAAGSAEQR